MRGDQRAPESPCPRDQQYSHYSSPPVIIPPGGPGTRPADPQSSRALHPAIAGKCPGQARRDLVRAGLRSQEDAKGLGEPRDRRTGGDTVRTRAVCTAQTRPMFERSAVSARAVDEL